MCMRICIYIYKLIYLEKDEKENDEEEIKIIFKFRKNPYIANNALEKTLRLKHGVSIKSSHTRIQWKVHLPHSEHFISSIRLEIKCLLWQLL